MCTIQKYKRQYHDKLLQFLEICLPQSGRDFEHFWCLFDGEGIIGTAALKKLNSGQCELKSLYLLEQYHKRGLGRLLLNTAIQEAKRNGYGEIYLDTLSSSKRAVHLYEKAGFEQTERYNDNYTADIFMVLNLDK
ncbi:GNAT family N-acetyltransferase [Mediterraneibacter glycyrrhizinilyticus]|nr:GNAT family N-acetyltransferase [Mediterraneibacter glycyrrhizinilyticus]MBM6803656.1 GNAT family N-acetyltransferase [Mediterraneibacter glycyrrhizinilyticus]